ncbi:MAG: DAK2 domain-containing protein [Acidimicrobiales bacterium]
MSTSQAPQPTTKKPTKKTTTKKLVECLGAAELVDVIVAYRDALRSHQELINRLNVYPVPDGDTGTNMALTLESVVQELAGHEGGDLATVAGALSHGSLMGARGNSGVILSQILRGLADAARDSAGIDAAVLTDGLGRARDGAYQAVQQPVEGTILTVVRAGAEAAEQAAGTALIETLTRARGAAAAALAHTPEQLPALKRAGVVDSGGAGLLLLFDAFLHVVDGRDLPEAPAELGAGPGPGPGTGAGSSAGDASADGPRYEVMYLLEAPDEAIPGFRDVWAGVGDSIVVVGGDGVWNCHIHTDDIGAAVEAALDAGRPCQIRVSDLYDHVEEERWVREAAGAGAPAGEPGDAGRERVGCAVVAVCSGEGIRRIFHSLGVQQIVGGGQSMNPSTAELLAAIEAAPADEVVVLPNNKNIVPVAEAAAQQSPKRARVIPTGGIPEGFAALLEYDPEGDAETNAAGMESSVARIVAGEVTRAIRASESDAGPIEAGDYLGLSRTGIVAVDPTPAGAATGLLSHLIDVDHHEILTIITGEGSTPAETRRITEWVREEHPEVETEVLPGGQPLYPYFLSIE